MAVRPGARVTHKTASMDIPTLAKALVDEREKPKRPSGNPQLAAKNAGIGGDASHHRQAPIGPYGLTVRQMKFVEGLLGGLNYSDAYREAYDTTNMADRSVNTAACQLHMRPNVQAAISDAMERAGKALVVTAASLTMMTKRAYDLGEKSGNAGHMVNAVALMAKLNGLIVDRSERKVEAVGTVGDRADMVAELRKLTSALGIQIIDASPLPDDTPTLIAAPAKDTDVEA